MWEYNCNKIVEVISLNPLKYETRVLGPIIIAEKTVRALSLELLSQGFILNTKIDVKDFNDDKVLIFNENQELIIELIPMV